MEDKGTIKEKSLDKLMGTEQEYEIFYKVSESLDEEFTLLYGKLVHSIKKMEAAYIGID